MTDGVRISTEALWRLRPIAGRLKTRARRGAHAAASAGYRSNFRGRGVDFEQTRLYAPGDDVRNMDWRVTARTGKPHTKIYREERERPVLLIVDVGASMAFGTRRAFKSVLAAEAAALIAWLAVDNGDRVGGVVCGDGGFESFRPQPRLQGVLHLFGCMERLQAPPGTSSTTTRLNVGLNEATRMAQAGSRIFIISDFANLSDEGYESVEHCGRIGRAYVGHVWDPLEQALPVPGDYRLTDGLRSWIIQGQLQRERHAYRSAFAARQAAFAARCELAGVESFELCTAQAPENTLLETMARLPGFP